MHRYLYAYSNPTVYIDLYGYAAQAYAQPTFYSGTDIFGASPVRDTGYQLLDELWAGTDSILNMGGYLVNAAVGVASIPSIAYAEVNDISVQAADEEIAGYMASSGPLAPYLMAGYTPFRAGPGLRYATKTAAKITEELVDKGTTVAKKTLKEFGDTAGDMYVAASQRMRTGAAHIVDSKLNGKADSLAGIANERRIAERKINFGNIPEEHHWRYKRYLNDPDKGNLAPADWYEATKRIWKNNKNGNAFERQVRQALGALIGKGSKPSKIDSFIPDLPVGLQYGVTDIKDWKDLHVDDQLRAFYKHARMNRLPLNLVISPRTKSISEPLLDLIRNTRGGNVFQYDSRLKKFATIDIGKSGRWSR